MQILSVKGTRVEYNIRTVRTATGGGQGTTKSGGGQGTTKSGGQRTAKAIY